MSLKSITAAAWLERSLAGPRTLVGINAQRRQALLEYPSEPHGLASCVDAPSSRLVPHRGDCAPGGLHGEPGVRRNLRLHGSAVWQARATSYADRIDDPGGGVDLGTVWGAVPVAGYPESQPMFMHAGVVYCPSRSSAPSKQRVLVANDSGKHASGASRH